MVFDVVPAKLCSPALPADRLARPRLGAHDEAVTVLSAGPGYGKTVALTGLVEAARGDGRWVAWYGLDAYDADPVVFFRHLLAALGATMPGFGTGIAAGLAAGVEDARAVWTRLFHELAAFNPPPGLLALDDVHHLHSAPAGVLDGLAYHFDKLPAGLRVAIATRKQLPLALARLVAHGNVRILGPSELAFSADEQQALARARQVLPARLMTLQALDGWPLGLDVALRGASDGLPRGAGDPSSTVPSARRLAAYIAQELYRSRSEGERAFVLRAAILEGFTADACRTVTQDPAAATRIESLLADHLLVRTGGLDEVRFPTYLRDFLRDEGRRVCPGIERMAWHRLAAEHYSELGAAEDALPHWVAARDWERALAAGQRAFPVLIASGRHVQARAWLEAIPTVLGTAEGWPRMWRGLLLERIGRPDAAVALFERARAAFIADGDPRGELKAMVRLAAQAVSQGAMQQFRRLIMQSGACLEAGDDEDRAELALVRARAALGRADEPLARECLQEATCLEPLHAGAAAVHSRALLLLAELDVTAGKLDAAEDRLTEARQLACRWGLVPARVMGELLSLRLRVQTGQMEVADALERGLPQGYEVILSPADLPGAHLARGAHALARGALDDAAALLERAEAAFRQAGDRRGATLAAERLAWLAAIEGERLPQDLVIPSEASDLPELMLATTQARTWQLAGRPEQALQVLRRAVVALARQDAPLPLARARLCLAAAAQSAGEATEAREVFGVVRPELNGPLAFLRQQDLPLWASLAPLEEETALRSSIGAGSGREPSRPATDGLLAVRLLGAMRVELNGVTLDQWPRRKAKVVLAALLLYPRGLSSESLVELLSHGEMTDRGATTLQVNVSALRRVLEPQLAKGDASRYVQLVDGRYFLDPAWVTALDVTAFIEAVRDGDGLKATQPDLAATVYEQALCLYRGNLLDERQFANYFSEERESYRRRAVDCLAWLARRYHRHGRNDDAVRVLERMLEISPCEEDGYLELMALYEAMGRLERAREVYWACRKMLKLQLGLSPSREIEEAYRALAEGTVSGV